MGEYSRIDHGPDIGLVYEESARRDDKRRSDEQAVELRRLILHLYKVLGVEVPEAEIKVPEAGKEFRQNGVTWLWC